MMYRATAPGRFPYHRGKNRVFHPPGMFISQVYHTTATQWNKHLNVVARSSHTTIPTQTNKHTHKFLQ